MKRILMIASFATLFIALLPSCKRFLEKPVSSDVTVDSVFASKDKALQFLWTVYSTASIYEFPYYWDAGDQAYRHYGTYCAPVACATDEADAWANYAGTDFINKGNWDATTVQYWEFNSYYCYRGIRNANIFIENIDKSPYSAQEKASMKAEAIFLRALMHFDLMQRLGGVPLIDKALKVTSAADIPETRKPRATLEETVNFIVKDCDEAAKSLPNTYPSNYKGRIVKGAALALKARTLLYAASPLFNSATPYMPVANPQLRAMVGYTNYDANRWQLAATASKAVLDWAASESGWCSLYMGKTNAVDRYEEIFVNPNVNEIILDAGLMGTNTGNYFCRFMLPGKIVYTGTDMVNIGVTFNYTKFYQKADGTDQVWNETEGQAYPYTQYKQKLGELEPRFQASVFQSGTEWSRGTGTFYNFYEQGANYLNIYNGVGFMRKFLKGVFNGSSPAPRWITFRLAEFYLNYAEALNEVNGSAGEIEWALKQVRDRVNMPAITYTNQADMRQKIRRERNVELAFEEHRYFDVRRWKIAGNDGVMKGGMYSLKLYAGSPATYKVEKFEDRVWDDKMYLYPFKQAEVDLGYVIQNPGW
jgi:starch-binding outer membrane protein, SusD/RagB family